MRRSKIVVLTRVAKDETFGAFWSGDKFYQSSNAKHGILDERGLTQLLKYKYMQSVDKFVGDFCLMPHLVK